MLEEFQVFYVTGWTRLLRSILVLLFSLYGRAVACLLLVLLVLTHLALRSRRVLSHRMEKCAQSMLRPPSSSSSKTWTIFL